MEIDSDLVSSEIRYLKELFDRGESLCADVQGYAYDAAEHMDSQNGKEASERLWNLMNDIRSTLPTVEDSIVKLARVRSQLDDLALR